MQNILLFIGILLGFSPNSGVDNYIQLPVDGNTGLITYEETIPVPNVSKQELKKSVTKWFGMRSRKANDELKTDNSENGNFRGKGFVEVFKTGTTKPRGGFVDYDISIFIQDGEIKYNISNFYHKGVYKDISNIGKLEKDFPGPELDLEDWNNYKQQVDVHIKKLIVSLIETVKYN